MQVNDEAPVSAAATACACEVCKKKKGLPNGVRSRRIHEYSSTPRGGWVARRTAAESRAGSTAPTFGIELETMEPSSEWVTDLPDRPYVDMLPMDPTPADLARQAQQRERYAEWHARNAVHLVREEKRIRAAGKITADEAVSLAAPRGMWHAKHDGSVTGPEFASQPATLAYWRASRPHLTSMFKTLLHGGMRSHDGDRCGLHINIGTDAFYPEGEYTPDYGHLLRFATLIGANERWAIRMSQRTRNSSRSWADFHNIESEYGRERWASRLAADGVGNDDHCSALNSSHRGRIEFRLPRGTLRVDRFYAKLEWVASMIEYTRHETFVTTPAAYMRWVMEGNEYPELKAYIAERFDAAQYVDDTDDMSRVEVEEMAAAVSA